ncbi:MAG TPA: thrombospondin type 3 repeat-containing protein, partial [Ferruginibacter sp.]|nr:thrombospondin type 3 repeat-containing protein [Ferruginibacter sp.]
YRNNVIYNWGGNNVYAGEGGRYNIVNNYYKPGPATAKNARTRIVNPYNKPPTIPFGKFYVAGNYVEGSTEVTANNWLGVVMNNGTDADAKVARLDKPIAVLNIPATSASEAYSMVLKNVGAILPKRDTLDERLIRDVQQGTGKLIDVQGGYPHGTAYELTVNAWPFLRSMPAPADSDKDGMPDEWEIKHGLDPNNATDTSGNKISKTYTNIEVYLNGILK